MKLFTSGNVLQACKQPQSVRGINIHSASIIVVCLVCTIRTYMLTQERYYHTCMLGCSVNKNTSSETTPPGTLHLQECVYMHLIVRFCVVDCVITESITHTGKVPTLGV